MVFMVWTAQDYFYIPSNLHVRAQAFDAQANGGLGQYQLAASGYNATDPDYSGYATCDFDFYGANDFAAAEGILKGGDG